MSLQWTAVATFLYIEVFFVLLLCIPFISPKRSEVTTRIILVYIFFIMCRLFLFSLWSHVLGMLDFFFLNIG